MQNCVGEKEIITVQALQAPAEQNKLEETLKTIKNDSEDEKSKLEEVAESIKEIAKKDEDAIVQAKENLAYAGSKGIAANYAEQDTYHNSAPAQNYYAKMMGAEKVPDSAQTEYYEQKAEQEAQKSQYLARESFIFGAQVTTNGSPSRDEQTALSSSSDRMEQQWIKKNTQPGWWQCLWDLSKYAVISDFG